MFGERLRSRVVCLPVLFLVLTSQRIGQSKPTSNVIDGDSEESLQLLVDVLEALEKATHFFSKDYGAVNVDGLFGIRLAQELNHPIQLFSSNIVEAVRFCTENNVLCPPDLINRLQYFNESIGTLGEKALPYVKEDDPEYFIRFTPTVDGPYIVPYEPVSIADYIARPGSQDKYKEDDGDACLASLMGTYEKDGKLLPKCSVSDDCWTLMTKPDQRRYSITHQLLFFIVGEKAGCLDELNQLSASRNGSSVKELEKHFCGHIVTEMRENSKDGHVKMLNQDLFLEQTVLCGILGYREIFSPSWIRMVLKWQTSMGCFSMPALLVEVEAELQRVSDEQRQLMRLLEEEAEAIDKSSATGRKLLREKIMDDECLSHKSGLGFGVIGVYLRFLIQTLFSR